MRALNWTSLCSQTPQQFQIISSWHEIKSIKGKITTECCADPAAARLRSQGLSSQKWDWREWDGGGKTLSPGLAGLWVMVPEMWTSIATCKATQWQNQTLSVGCEKERCGPSHTLGLFKGFCHLVSLWGPKQSKNRIRTSNKRNSCPRGGRSRRSCPEAYPCLCQGSLPGLG